MNNRSLPIPEVFKEDEAFLALVEFFFDGSLSAEQLQNLNHLLRMERSKRELFRAICMQDQMIFQARNVDRVLPVGIDEDEDDFWIKVNDLKVEAGSVQMVDLTEEMRRRERLANPSPAREKLTPVESPQIFRHYIIPRPLAYGTAAALIAVLVMLASTLMNDRSQHSANHFIDVATLIDAVDARWGRTQYPVAVGEPIYSERIELKSGYAKIRFASQAEITIEAPCVFQPLSDTEMRLISGRIVGRCELPQSKNFVVHTSHLRIVDIGTEFGVKTVAGRSDAVHVFEGEVNVAMVRADGSSASVDSKMRLTTGQAVQVDSSGKLSSVFPVEKHAFVRDTTPEQIDPLQRYARYIRSREPLAYWRGESLSGSLLHNVMNDAHHGKVFGNLRVTKDAALGPVLDFPSDDRMLHYVLIDEKLETLMAGDYTIECWARPRLHHDGVILSARVPNAASSTGDVAADDLATDDLAAAMLQFCEVTTEKAKQVGVHDYSIRYLHRDYPSTDLSVGTNVAPADSYTPGKWHHIVAVKRGRNMELYMDGIHIGSTRSKADWSEPVFLLLGTTSNEPRQFQGQLDELAVYDRALSPDEVAQHHQMLRSTVLMEEESN